MEARGMRLTLRDTVLSLAMTWRAGGDERRPRREAQNDFPMAWPAVGRPGDRNQAINGDAGAPLRLLPVTWEVTASNARARQ